MTKPEGSHGTASSSHLSLTVSDTLAFEKRPPVGPGSAAKSDITGRCCPKLCRDYGYAQVKMHGGGPVASFLPQRHGHERTCAVPETPAEAAKYLIKMTSFCASL